MSCRVWRGVGALSDEAARGVQQATRSGALPPLPDRLVVELLRDGDDWLVMLATLAPGDDDAQRALIAFGPCAQRIDRLRELGFIASEACITARADDSGTWMVEVLDPQCVTGAPGCWVRVHGVRLDLPGVAPVAASTTVRHRHVLAAPAPEDPTRQVERAVELQTLRREPCPAPAGGVELLSLGVIEIAALVDARRDRPLPLPEVQLATLELPPEWLALRPAPSPAGALLPPDPALVSIGVPRRADRMPLLKATGYRFTNVEILGFRIDLSDRDDVDATLQQMVQPLNFHRHARGRQQGWGAQAFHWRPAARVLVIELLRYGRMYWGEQQPYPGEPWTAQHELLLRVLVGRVDDASAQARDPALYVPAIWVDNPWSRWIGRELQGFPKQLARFGNEQGWFDRSGRLKPDAEPVPLVRTSRVHTCPRLTEHARSDAGAELLGLELPPGADDPAIWADVRLLMGHAGWRDAHWRQGDFTDPQFRREFAGQALGLNPARMASVQVSPVDGRDLPAAWVDGWMVFERMQAGMPDGVATLHLPRESAALPPAWRALTKLFPERRLSLPTGSWYRARADLCMEPAEAW
ncbi:MAG: acetoacetate decarboxylase family protein [Rubrivivax sp.]